MPWWPLRSKRVSLGQAGRRAILPERTPATRVTETSSLLTGAAGAAAKGIAGAKRGQGPQGRASGRERANRGFPIRERRVCPDAPRLATPCRLEAGDTAGWKPALRRPSWRSAQPVAQTSSLLYRGFLIRRGRESRGASARATGCRPAASDPVSLKPTLPDKANRRYDAALTVTPVVPNCLPPPADRANQPNAAADPQRPPAPATAGPGRILCRPGG